MLDDFGCRRCCLGLLAVLFVVGCNAAPDQSALHPAGPAAAEIAWLWWVMLSAFTAVFILVVVLMLAAVFQRSTTDSSIGLGTSPPLGRTGFVVGGGLVLPIIVLTPLYLLSLKSSSSLRVPQEGVTIRVIGHQWWWEVRYPQQGIVTANEIHIPVGQPVRLELTSADVIHSFWVPRLNGKRDLIPGIETEFWIQAEEPGVYRGQCGEYCGTQHANMALEVIALPRQEFAAWLAERPQPRPQPVPETEPRGLQVFLRSGCSQCHAVEGTRATGNVGPDLTHFGSRQTIAAAMRPNTRGNLAAWIADPQALKPGVKMPRTDLAADDREALLDYLEGLQ
jgi:cytochrome c oxidase subunit 2